MKQPRGLVLILSAIFILFGLLVSPAANRSLAQKDPSTPTVPRPTKTATPFVSHPVVVDPVMYSGEQLRAAYGVQPLIDAGFDGEGQTIALIEIGNFAQKDVDSFVKRNRLPKPHIETIIVGGPKARPLPTDAEATADIEVVLSIAPKATIIVYETPLAVDALPRILKDNRASVVSISLAICELVLPRALFPELHRYFAPAHAQRLSIFVGSGDWGAFACKQQIDPATEKQVIQSVAQKISVSAFASDPSVTAVGGTILRLKGGQYGSEEVWNTSHVKGSSGGGMSSYWPLPSYQNPYYLSDLNPQRKRQIPDVSASADNYRLIIYGATVRGTGTSLSTPLWAAGTLLVNQYLSSKLNDSEAVLLAPEMLYQLKTLYTAGKLDWEPFHEVAKGDNRYYVAGPGYDLATGLGTPDFYNIARDVEQLYSQQTDSRQTG